MVAMATPSQESFRRIPNWIKGVSKSDSTALYLLLSFNTDLERKTAQRGRKVWNHPDQKLWDSEEAAGFRLQRLLGEEKSRLGVKAHINIVKSQKSDHKAACLFYHELALSVFKLTESPLPQSYSVNVITVRLKPDPFLITDRVFYERNRAASFHKHRNSF